MRGPTAAEHLSKREIDQMAREMAGKEFWGPARGPGPLPPATPMTEAEKHRKAEELHRQIFGDLPVPRQGAVQTAAEGVRAGAEAQVPGQKNRGSSAAARAPEGRGPTGPQTNTGSTGSCAPEDRGADPDPRKGPAGQETPEIPERLKTKPNKRENEFMLNLMILRNTLLRNAPACRERARLAGKWIWRDIRLATVLICRIQEALLRTMPSSREDYYIAYARHGHYELHIDGPIRTPRQLLVTDKHLGTICEAAMRSECILCIREGKEIDQCELREALLESAAPTNLESGDSIFRKCEYRDAAGKLIHGEDVNV